MNSAKTIVKAITDGWGNLFTGFGIAGRDKTKSTRFLRDVFLQEPETIGLYESDGFAKRVIDLPVREMTRKGFVIEGDTDGEIVDYYKSKGFDIQIRNLLRWAKVYGGAVGVMLIDDGQENLSEPLDENRINEIEKIKVYHRWRVDRNTHIDREPISKTFGETLLYMISPSETTPFLVHRSRILVIDGIDLPEDERKRNNNWGVSVYQGTQNQIKRLSVIYALVESIVDDFVSSTMTMENLQDMIAGGQEDIIKKRLEFIDMSKHIINTRLLDKNETFTKVSSSVAGIPDVIEKFAMALSAVTGIPFTLLMGQSPKGLQATGASEIRFWYDNVNAEQEEILLPPVRRLIRLIQLSKNGPTNGKELTDWKIKFVSLWQQTEEEQAKTRKLIAEADKLYIESNVLDPAEVAVSRFGGNEYSAETSLFTDDIKQRINANEPEEND